MHSTAAVFPFTNVLKAQSCPLLLFSPKIGHQSPSLHEKSQRIVNINSSALKLSLITCPVSNSIQKNVISFSCCVKNLEISC